MRRFPHCVWGNKGFSSCTSKHIMPTCAQNSMLTQHIHTAAPRLQHTSMRHSQHSQHCPAAALCSHRSSTSHNPEELWAPSSPSSVLHFTAVSKCLDKGLTRPEDISPFPHIPNSFARLMCNLKPINWKSLTLKKNKWVFLDPVIMTTLPRKTTQYWPRTQPDPLNC